ncbi:hypothetical protein JD844_001685 [Phrynosoma platyrhinos]|uniref:VIT domain-containing protein n=1 Tax=Phrynosoma platyrhinos TaxID=52577 RepID=A0ABQ7TA51_PHRPL|nr:hypothetical protein JD844_001685 [Phrynosoma platyrhinos]
MLPERKYPAKVPLQSISVDVVIKDFIANVAIELQYKNKGTVSLEVVVDVRLDKDVAVYAFEGIVDGKRVEAQIMEKGQVKQKVEEIWGKDATLFKWDPNDRDIFGCMLGSLPPDGEATLKLHFVQALAPAPGGATRFVLPVVPNPHYVPQASEDDSVMDSTPEVLEEQLSCPFSLSATLDSHHGISHVESNYTLAGLQYITEDHTTAQISLTEGHHFEQDVELLIYYEEEFHKPVALVEPGKPGADPGSLMRDPVLLLSLYSKISAPKPGLNATGEFLFLVECSNNMSYSTGRNPDSRSRIQSAKVPPGWTKMGHNGSSLELNNSCKRKSVKYTQWTMLDSVRRVMALKANLGEAEILQPLKAIYSQPCYEGYARQLFVFVHRETSDMDEVIAEVQTHSCSHRCFTFGIGEWATFHTLNGMAEAGHGSAEFIQETEKMQAKDLGLSEGSVVLQYSMQGWTFMERITFSLKLQENERFPLHCLAARTLLQELKGAHSMEEQRLALQTSLSSGVVCSQTAYIVVNTEPEKLFQVPIYFQNHFGFFQFGSFRIYEDLIEIIESASESLVLRLICLQNADGSWSPETCLLNILGLNEAETFGKMPVQLHHFLSRISFNNSVGDTVHFNENREIVAAFDWLMFSNGSMVRVKVGRLDLQAPPGQELTISKDQIVWHNIFNQVLPLSVCNDNCYPGYRRKKKEGEAFCCYDCTPCQEGTISIQKDMDACVTCPEDQYPNEDKTQCIPRVPGDLIIGAIVSQVAFFNDKVSFMREPSRTLTELTISVPKNYQHILALAFAVKEINKNPKILSNLSLGFHILNSYYTARMIYKATLSLFSTHNRFVPNFKCHKQNNLIALIGGCISEISANVAILSASYKAPQFLPCSSGGVSDYVGGADDVAVFRLFSRQ